MASLGQYFALVRHLGVGWLWFRMRYALRRRLGGLRRVSPVNGWQDVPATELRLAARRAPSSAEISEGIVSEADAILRGCFRLFSHREVEAGELPDWHRNQLTGEMAPRDRHWSELGDFAFGDIKGVWELSRFPWAFALTRAHVRTGDGKYADAFWRLFADWCERNPPNLGPNWMCGQEATFRLMAVIFAAESMGVPSKRQAMLARFIVATGRRISANLDYALSQKNNHGISECIGLITAALLTPAHPESALWLTTGLSKLQAQCSELIYEDGGFSQHSLIYHRVLMHDLCWLRHRLVVVQQQVPVWLDAAGRRGLSFLRNLTDPATGRAPLYGPNDGANILPLAEAAFLDMRPAVQLGMALFYRELPLDAGPWDEAVRWLTDDFSGLKRVPWVQPPARWHAADAGCLQLVDGAARLFLRCPTQFRHRPSQADLLHVDVWHRGQAIVFDGGSFSYNSRERFTSLGAAAHHNVLTVDGCEPMRKFSQFLYLPWPKGEAAEGSGGTFAASHDGYAQLGVRWTRSVAPQTNGGYTVTDNVIGAAGHRLQWHWRLANANWTLGAKRLEGVIDGVRYRLAWSGAEGISGRLAKADEHSARGWWSPFYGAVEPVCALVMDLEAKGEVAMTMEFSWVR